MLRVKVQLLKVPNDIILRNHYKFVEAILPVAKEAGVLLSVHPDDPPRPLLGKILAARSLNKCLSVLPYICNAGLGLFSTHRNGVVLK